MSNQKEILLGRLKTEGGSNVFIYLRTHTMQIMYYYRIGYIADSVQTYDATNLNNAKFDRLAGFSEDGTPYFENDIFYSDGKYDRPIKVCYNECYASFYLSEYFKSEDVWIKSVMPFSEAQAIFDDGYLIEM